MPEIRTPASLHNSSFSIEERARGEEILVFKDPFTDTPLDPNIPPPSLEAEPELNDGLEYLRQNSSDIVISILGMHHGQGDEPDVGHLRSIYSRHDAILLEGLGHSATERRGLAIIARRGDEVTTKLRKRGDYGHHFVDPEFAALQGLSKPTFFVDIPSDGTNYEKSLYGWSTVVEDIDQYGVGEKTELDFTKAINLTVANVIFREWYMVARTGLEMSNLRAKGQKIKRPVIKIGALHIQTLPYRLEALGVKSKIIVPKMLKEGPPAPVEVPFDLLRAAAQCAIKLEVD